MNPPAAVDVAKDGMASSGDAPLVADLNLRFPGVTVAWPWRILR